MTSLVDTLYELRQEVAEEGQKTLDRWRPMLRRASFRPNMAHYLALRKHDIRPIQEALTPWGLSSLGRSEGRRRGER